jgi:tetratricopeptide (TPR) repeat protein
MRAGFGRPQATMDPIPPRSLGSIIEAFLIVLATLGIIGWLFWRTLKKSDEPVRNIWKAVLTIFLIFSAFKLTGPMLAKGGYDAVFGMLLCLPITIVIAILWAANIAATVFSPLTSLFDGGREEAEPGPFYSVVESRLHQGRFAEAATEIRRQLTLYPNDIRGRIMLAEIQANKLGQPSAAEATLREILRQPNLAAPGIASALNLLADVHLKSRHDPLAAREALEEIIARLPDTVQAANAAERIGHLPTVETMEARDTPASVELKAGIRDLGLKHVALPDPAETLDRRLTALLDQVQAFPGNTETRAELVRMLAEDLADLDSARAQISSAMAVPHQSPRQISRWMNLLATIEIRQGHNLDGARRALQRIVDQFPDSAVAETAQQRMGGLATELKGTGERREVHLGIYEKDLGLKRKLES